MASVDARLRDRYGLHPRAALRIQQALAGQRAKVTLQGLDGGGAAVDATSLISLVSAGIGSGETVRISAVGEDAEAALAELAALLEAGICHP